MKDQILIGRKRFKTVKSVIEPYRLMTKPVLGAARKAAQHGLQVVASGQKRRQGEDPNSSSKRAKSD